MASPVAEVPVMRRAILSDWAETRLMLVSLEAQLEKCVELTRGNPPALRAVREGLAILQSRCPVSVLAKSNDLPTEDQFAGLVITPESEYALALRLRRRPPEHRADAPPPEEPLPLGLPRRDPALAPPRTTQLRVVELVVEGLSNEEIAERLYCTSNTVRSHIKTLLKMYGLASRTGIAVLALRQGWFS